MNEKMLLDLLKMFLNQEKTQIENKIDVCSTTNIGAKLQQDAKKKEILKLQLSLNPEHIAFKRK